MNFFLTDIPDRTKQLRDYGLTMMMDKGLRGDIFFDGIGLFLVLFIFESESYSIA